jgi:hypothetical protein
MAFREPQRRSPGRKEKRRAVQGRSNSIGTVEGEQEMDHFSLSLFM